LPIEAWSNCSSLAARIEVFACGKSGAWPHRESVALQPRKTLLFTAVFSRNFFMADKASKQPGKRSRSLHVDTTCTPCRVSGRGSESLKYNDDETYVYFYKQPENEGRNGRSSRAPWTFVTHSPSATTANTLP
jgi:hypothetical protein